MKSLLLSSLLLTAAAATASEWSLPRDLNVNPAANPPPPWRFEAVTRAAPPVCSPLGGIDWNPDVNRVIFHAAGRGVWSRPAIHVTGFRHSGERVMTFQTGAADPAAVWVSPLAGEVEYELELTDPKDRPAGASGNAWFAVELASRDATRRLDGFSWFRQRRQIRTGRVTVAAGDRLIFRKTVNAPDDFANGDCRARITVRAGSGTAPRSGWTVWAAGRSAVRPAEYRPLPESRRSDRIDFRPPGGRPSAVASTLSGMEFQGDVMAEKDAAADRSGDLLLRWICPADGTYRYTCRVANVGTDVKGGDGGTLQVTFLRPDSEVDSSLLQSLRLDSSSRAAAAAECAEVLDLRAGDCVQFRFHANLDGYGDCFRTAIRFAPDPGPGRRPATPDVELLIPRPPVAAARPGAPLRRNLFWLGTSGNWANGPQAEESLALFRRYVPELGTVMVGSFPERFRQPGFYRARNIPTIIQSFGSGFEPYWRIHHAFEQDQNGYVHAWKSSVTLSGTGHAGAHPHPAFIKAFKQLAESSVRSGYSGYGFNDMVWMWGPGRGATGHSPATVKAFRSSLAGTDEGLTLAFGDAPVQRFHFADYAKFYLGAAPEPALLGLKDWNSYAPLNREQLRRCREQNLSTVPHLLVFDLLVHYEWLKSAQRIGVAAEAAGGFFQCMPNPEDLANGNDLYFLSALKHVRMNSEEYFQSPRNWQGAYFRYPYLVGPVSGDRQYGIVLEAGGGGNAAPYYDQAVALLLAYDITLATAARHLEGDFWPQSRHALAVAARNQVLLDRYRQLLMYGLGYRFGVEDRPLGRIAPDFVSFTSRRLFRPWGHLWHVWNDRLDNELSPDRLLAENGYIFAGRGEENLPRLETALPVVFYSAAPPTRMGWDALLGHLRSGRIGNAVAMASGLRQIVTPDYRLRNFADVFPEFAFEEVPGPVRGRLFDRDVTVSRTFRPLHPERFETVVGLGGRPLVVRARVGSGNLYILLLAPTAAEAGKTAPDAAVGVALWDRLLRQLGVAPHWRSDVPGQTMNVRLYRSGPLLAAFALRMEAIPGGRSFWKHGFGEDSRFSLRLEPDRVYHYVTFPGLRTGQVRSDARGWASLVMVKRSMEFFFLAADPAQLPTAKLRSRLELIRRALSLDGRVSAPAVFP